MDEWIQLIEKLHFEPGDVLVLTATLEREREVLDRLIASHRAGHYHFPFHVPIIVKGPGETVEKVHWRVLEAVVEEVRDKPKREVPK